MKKSVVWSACFILIGNTMLCAQDKGSSEAAKKQAPSKTIAGAAKEHPFVNSLGMKFVPVAGTKVLFSIWDTRVQDYRAYAKANPGIDTGWKIPDFKQGEDHPVLKVSWYDAKAFCAWLTKKERKSGVIGKDQEYRLPADAEWSVAVGTGKYPWGNQWPPPKGAGNYDPSLKVDGYPCTSPVGSFAANQYGLYDMGGNVWQWCEDWYRSDMNAKASPVKSTEGKDAAAKKYHVVRGAGWGGFGPDRLLSSFRSPGLYGRDDFTGFRCVLVTGLSSR
jgi:formylglycine-generating enzyme required for sulfatase activity